MLIEQFKKFLKDNKKGRNLRPQLPLKKKFFDNSKKYPTISMERTQARM